MWDLAELKARGEQVFAANCAMSSGRQRGLPPAFLRWMAPPWFRSQDGPDRDRSEGREGTAMAAFGKQLTDTRLAAVITYTRNAWGNHTDEAIQPAEIAASR